MKKTIFILNSVILLLSIAWLVSSKYDYEPIIVCITSIISLIANSTATKISYRFNSSKVNENTIVFTLLSFGMVPFMMFISYFSSESYIHNEFYLIKFIAYFFWVLNFLYSTSIWIGFLQLSLPKDYLYEIKGDKNSAYEFRFLIYVILFGYFISSWIIPNPAEKYFVIAFVIGFYLNAFIFLYNIFFNRKRNQRKILLKWSGFNIVIIHIITFMVFLLGHPVSTRLLLGIEGPWRFIINLIQKYCLQNSAIIK